MHNKASIDPVKYSFIFAEFKYTEQNLKYRYVNVQELISLTNFDFNRLCRKQII